MKSLAALLCLLAITGCTTRKEQESSQTKGATETVTRTETVTTVDVVAEVPNVGPVRMVGTVKDTVFTESVAKSQADTERRLTASNPAIEAIWKTGASVVTGGLSGGLDQIVTLIITAITLGTTGYAAKKAGESRELKGRVARAESNEDELYTDLKKTKET